MAELKLRLKVTLQAGDDMFNVGQIFEGTLDEFPKPIQTEYTEKNWHIIEVLTDAKGQDVQKAPKPATGTQSTKIQPTADKKPKDNSQGSTARTVQGPSTVEVNPGAQIDADSKKAADETAKDAAESKGDSGADASDSSDNTAQADSKKAAVKAAPKAKPKLKVKPKAKPKAAKLKKKS